MKPLLGHFPEDIPRAYNGILAIRSCFALKAQSIAEIESDNRSARVLQQEITQRANGDSVSDARALGLGRPSMPRIDFRSRRRFQLIQQIRSEERRVGKEGSSWWAQDDYTNISK